MLPVALILATILAAQGDRMALFEERMPLLLGLGGFFLIVAPDLCLKIAIVIWHRTRSPAGGWQSHHHVLGMDITFFNNEFAGQSPIGLQTGLARILHQIGCPALRHSLFDRALGILIWNNPLLVLPALLLRLYLRYDLFSEIDAEAKHILSFAVK